MNRDAFRSALRTLLDRLDAIARDHEEVGDTEVRERMAAVLYHGFIAQRPGYEVPKELGMFDASGNALVAGALREFLAAADAGDGGTASAGERWGMLQDPQVRSTAGSTYDTYLGHSDSLEELASAMDGSRGSEPSPAKSPSAPSARRPWWRFW